MIAPNRFELNEAQARAVTHGSGSAVCGPMLVIAGAGSGKTSTLAHRVAHLVSEGVDPARVLLLTFSRRAAQELERRVGRVPGCETSARVRSSADVSLGRNFSWHRRADSSRVRRAPRSGSELHHSRPRRFGRPDGVGQACARRRRRDEHAFPRSRDLPGNLLACRERGIDVARSARMTGIRGVLRIRTVARSICRLCRRQAGAADPGFRRPADLLGGHDARAGVRGGSRRSSSIT